MNKPFILTKNVPNTDEYIEIRRFSNKDSAIDYFYEHNRDGDLRLQYEQDNHFFVYSPLRDTWEIKVVV